MEMTDLDLRKLGHFQYTSQAELEGWLTLQDLEPTRGHCYQCKYWAEFDAPVRTISIVDGNCYVGLSWEGECHFMPPHLPPDKKDCEHYSYHPSTRAVEWCGQFAPCHEPRCATGKAVPELEAILAKQEANREPTP